MLNNESNTSDSNVHCTLLDLATLMFSKGKVSGPLFGISSNDYFTKAINSFNMTHLHNALLFYSIVRDNDGLSYKNCKLAPCRQTFFLPILFTQ